MPFSRCWVSRVTDWWCAGRCDIQSLRTSTTVSTHDDDRIVVLWQLLSAAAQCLRASRAKSVLPTLFVAPCATVKWLCCSLRRCVLLLSTLRVHAGKSTLTDSLVAAAGIIAMESVRVAVPSYGSACETAARLAGVCLPVAGRAQRVRLAAPSNAAPQTA